MSNWICPEHQQVKFVPPGTSTKTGQPVPYDGFFCCPVKGCKQRPPKNASAPMQRPVQSVGPQSVAAPPPMAVTPNWDKIAEGKCRSLVLCAWIQSGRPMGDFWASERDFIVYMMQGRPPGFDERTLNEQWDPTDPGPQDSDNIFGA